MIVSTPAPLSDGQPAAWTPQFPPPVQAAQSMEGFSFSKLLLTIRRRSLWFGITFGVMFTTVGVVTIGQWLIRPQYQGGFRLLVRDPLSEGRRETGADLASLAQVNTSVDVPNLIQVLDSPMLLNPLAKRLGVSPDKFAQSISITRSGPDNDVLNITLTWDNPSQGGVLIEALSKEYLAYSLRQRREKLSQGLIFLDEQAPGLEQRVMNLQQELAAFRRVHTMLAPEEQSRALEMSRGSLAAELRSLNQTEAQLMGLLAMARSGQLVSSFQSSASTEQAETSSSGTPDAAKNIRSNSSPLLAELSEIEGQLATAQASFRADSPVVRNLRARRDRLRPLLQRREQDSILSALQVNRVQQQKVVAQMNSLAAEFRRNPELIKSYEALQQRLAVARENLGSYLQARETFRLEVAQSTVPWQVISPPAFGVIPVEPNLQSRLLQGLMLGLAAGAGMAYLRDRTDRVFHSQREVEEVLGLPLLGGVPYLPLVTDKPIAESIKELEPEERFVLRESLRTFYQSLRTLRANRTLRVVALTSSSAGEGKTTTTALLGEMLVDMGMKVLLVDADLRRARLHKRLGLDNSRGISEMFAESPPALEELYQWVNPNLAVITGGVALPDPARLLSSSRCGEIVQEIREQTQFDLILFDTPPALELVDPLLIAEHMDGLLLLVSVGKINRELPTQVIRKVQATNVDLLGVVVNQRVEATSGLGGYGYDYGYGYGYSSYGYISAYAPTPQPESVAKAGRFSQVLTRATSLLNGQNVKPDAKAGKQDAGGS